MNANTNFKSIQNTLVSQTTVNPVLLKDLVVSDYGLYSKDPEVFSYPIIISTLDDYFELNLEQLLRAKNNSHLMGISILVNSVLNDPYPLTLPVNDTVEGAFTLLNTLNLLNPGDQCILKFSRLGYNSLRPNASLYLSNLGNTSFNVQFAYNNSSSGPNCLLFGNKADGPYSLVVVTNITTKSSPSNYKIEFRTVVFSICCNSIENIPCFCPP